MQSEKVYNLAKGVQVRNEKFGLLFYNYRGPRLYFVPTRNMIASTFFDGQMPVGELITAIKAEQRWPRQWVADRVTQLLQMLEDKGLIYGQSIC